MAIRSIRNPIIRDTLVVTFFWWAIFTVQDLRENGYDPTVLSDIKQTLIFTGIGLLFGLCYTIYSIASFRYRQKMGLLDDDKRGLYSSLGPVPQLIPPPAQATQLPQKLPYPPELPAGFIEDWFVRYGESNPEHAEMMRALLRIYAKSSFLPATHLEGGHGGRTLFQHCLLASGLCIQLAPSWTHGPLVGSSGRVIVPLRNPGYEFDPDDPMIAILGLAHDIGKMECYVFDKTGKVVGSKYDHSQVGGRMLGRMEEVWNLPDEDRELLLTAVTFYHYPQDMPMDNGGVPFDDRTIALTELLIKADTMASRLENGQTTTEAENCDQPQSEDAKTKIWDGFVEVVTQAGRINGQDIKFRIGQKNCDETGRALVYLHESSLREALSKHINVDGNARLGDGTYVLTRALLKILEEKGVLYQNHEGATYSDTRALFIVEFRNKKQQHLSEWPATIVLVPGNVLPGLANMPDFSSVPTIKRARYGDVSAKNKTILEAAQEAQASGDEEVMFKLAPSRKVKVEPEKQAQKEDVPASPPSPAPVVEAAPEVKPVPEQTTPEPAAPSHDDIPDIGDPSLEAPEVADDEIPDINGDIEMGGPDDMAGWGDDSFGTGDSSEEADASQGPIAPDFDDTPEPETEPMPVAEVVAEEEAPAPEPAPEVIDVAAAAKTRAMAVVQMLLAQANAGTLQSATLGDGRRVMDWGDVMSTDPSLNWEGFAATIKAGGVPGIRIARIKKDDFLVIEPSVN